MLRRRRDSERIMRVFAARSSRARRTFSAKRRRVREWHATMPTRNMACSRTAHFSMPTCDMARAGRRFERSAGGRVRSRTCAAQEWHDACARHYRRQEPVRRAPRAATGSTVQARASFRIHSSTDRWSGCAARWVGGAAYSTNRHAPTTAHLRLHQLREFLAQVPLPMLL